MKYRNLSPEQVTLLESLNAKVRKEEIRAYKFYKKLELKLLEMRASGIIDDYNIIGNLQVFSNNEVVCQKYSDDIGDSIYEEEIPLSFNDEVFYQNWNEDTRNINNPLAGLYFGYMMHCILFHNDLDIEDILLIDDVWLEVKVDYQFFMDKTWFTV